MTGKLSGSKKKWFFKLLTFVSYFFFSLWLKTQCNGSHYHYFCGKVINGSLWFLVNVVSLCTVLFYFTVVTWLWSPFLFLINKLSNLPVLFLSSTTSYSQSAFTATYLLMCTMSLIFAAWFLDANYQIKSGPKKKMEKMKCCPNEMAFTGCSVHTLRCTKNTCLKNLGCCGTELLTFLILYKNFNTVFLFTVLATDKG